MKTIYTDRVIRCEQCGHEFSDSLGKYGCPNCAD